MTPPNLCDCGRYLPMFYRRDRHPSYVDCPCGRFWNTRDLITEDADVAEAEQRRAGTMARGQAWRHTA